VTIDIKTYSNVDLQKTVIPNRDYDLLLYGEDYGPDLIPILFGIRLKAAPAVPIYLIIPIKKPTKLLEDARQSF